MWKGYGNNKVKTLHLGTSQTVVEQLKQGQKKTKTLKLFEWVTSNQTIGSFHSILYVSILFYTQKKSMYNAFERPKFLILSKRHCVFIYSNILTTK